MRKVISGILICATLFATISCSKQESSSSDKKTTTTSKSETADKKSAAVQKIIDAKICKDIEPLAEPVHLDAAVIAGATSGFNFYLAEVTGAFDAAGLDVDVKTYDNGPIMVEAAASGNWDVAEYGLGGVLTGTIRQGILNIAAGNKDSHSQQFFAAKDSPIVAAGKNTPNSPLLYGDAETWKDKEIYLPIGTTLEYVLNKGLAQFGLTTEDVDTIHMSVPNINTALKAHKAEVGGLWGSYTYSDIKENFVPIMQAEDVGVTLLSNIAATETSYNDPVKQEAMKKFLEVVFKQADWINESEEHLNTAVDVFLEWNAKEGIKATRDELYAHLGHSVVLGLEDNYKLITEKAADGAPMIIEDSLDPLKFFIQKESYTPEDAETLVNPKYWPTKLVEELYAESQN